MQAEGRLWRDRMTKLFYPYIMNNGKLKAASNREDSSNAYIILSGKISDKNLREGPIAAKVN